MSQELENAVAEMEKRLAALEQGGSASKGPESERERMQRERQERIDAKREARPENDERRMGDPRPTSRQRKEDLSRRSSTVLPGPTMNPPKPPAPQAGKLGDTIEVVVVDNGEFKTGLFYVDGALTPVV